MNKLIGEVSEDQIAEWRGKCPAGIYALIAGGAHVGYFRNPTRHDVAKALSEASDENPLAAVEVFGRLTFLGGSEAILTDDVLFLAVRKPLQIKLQQSDISVKLVNL